MNLGLIYGIVDLFDSSTGPGEVVDCSTQRSAHISFCHIHRKHCYVRWGFRRQVARACDSLDVFDLADARLPDAGVAVALAAFCFAGACRPSHPDSASGIWPKDTVSGVVDLYDISTGKWSINELSVARSALAATSVGNIALFGGGASSELLPFQRPFVISFCTIA